MILDYLTRDTNECIYSVTDNHVTRLIEINGHRILFRVRAINNEILDIEFLNGTEPNRDLIPDVVVYVREWFDLDYDLQSFYDMARHDALLSQTITKEYGLRLMGINDLFEAFFWAILGQQINLTFAYTLKRRFVEKYGEYMEYEGTKYMLLPRVDDIAVLTPDDMGDVNDTTKK